MSELPARITMPSAARRGDIIEIRVLARHPMDRAVDAPGLTPVPRRIIHMVRASIGGEEIVRIALSTGIAANPYFAFTMVAMETGDVEFEWHEDGGAIYRRSARLTVT
ncbi:MAG: thiosulfate oxidation carrier complex protein SoxZ [Bosea sp. (in: a-proteobacteria)]